MKNEQTTLTILTPSEHLPAACSPAAARPRPLLARIPSYLHSESQ
jgi:hypothetical protein